MRRSKRLKPSLPFTTSEVPTSSQSLADSEYVHHWALCVVFKLVNHYTICNMIQALNDISFFLRKIFNIQLSNDSHTSIIITIIYICLFYFMFCMLNKTCLVLVIIIIIGHSRRLLYFTNHLHAMFGRNFPMASNARTVIYNIILIYFTH